MDQPMDQAMAERNLLVGFLGLQMKFLTRDQFVAGMNAWIGDKRRPLADVLGDLGYLSDDVRASLDTLVLNHMGLPGAAPRTPAGNDPYQTLSHAAPTSTNGKTRFRILRPHARGGLGEVFVARDEELSREVALKEIQAAWADDDSSRARFILEAEITGGLEHPGIVPVYGLGAYADGRPFYAMRFIRGDSLKEAIHKFHASQIGLRAHRLDLAESQRMLDFRQLLGRFVDVCQAVAYAHSRGVLHRDLKPGNVMLGKFGETLVVDWGLAKAQGRAEIAASDLSEAPLTPASDGSAPTIMGSAIGTPHYMSPEQAAGRIDLLSPASDIYSLGATLYSLLTGASPQTSHDRGEILQRIQRGEFPRPRSLKTDVPPALEAVCLRAMALKPEERYSSAAALADDVEHWLGDEPVTAYQEPWQLRIRRWGRKHATFVSVIAATVLMGLLAAGTSAAVLGQKNQQLETFNDNLELARDQALINEKEAIKERIEAQKQHQRAIDNERLAAEEHERVRKSLDFLVQAFRKPAAAGGSSSELTVMDVLSQAENGLDAAFAGDPLMKAEVMAAISQAYSGLGITDRALTTAQGVYQIYSEKLEPGHADTLISMGDLAAAYAAAGKVEKAESIARQTQELWHQNKSATWQPFWAAARLGAILVDQDKFMEAETWLTEAHAGLEKHAELLPPERKDEPANAAAELVKLYKAWEKPAEAAKWQAVSH